MKQNWRFNIPGSILFGNGSLSQLAQVAQDFSPKSVCLVTDRGVSEAGILNKALDVLKALEVPLVTFDEIEPEPDIKSVDQCAELAREREVDLFVGLGGGSPLDVAKGASVAAGHGGPISGYLGVDNVPGSTVPKILIPTTAGTGSEVTPFAIFKDKEKQLKTAIQSRHVVGDAVIVDPLLTHSCPPRVTAVCGMDALTHAIESYTSISASPFSAQCSLEAIALIGRSILQAYANGDHAEAREAMSLGSFYAGIGIANAGSGAVGALSYPVEWACKILHGLGNALLLPHVIAYNAIADYEKFEDISAALDLDYGTGREATAQVIDFINTLNETFGFTSTLGALGVRKGDIKALADDAITRQRILVNNMRKLDHQDIVKIYESAL